MADVKVEAPSDGIARRYLSVAAESLADAESGIVVPGGHFVLFLACDGTTISDDEIKEFSRSMIEKGVAYLVAWGPDCSRVHELFDLADVDRELEGGEPHTIMTSWHQDESFEEAFYFFLFNAFPDDEFANTCNTGIAVSVANEKWSASIRTSFADVPGLKSAPSGGVGSGAGTARQSDERRQTHSSPTVPPSPGPSTRAWRSPRSSSQ